MAYDKSSCLPLRPAVDTACVDFVLPNHAAKGKHTSAEITSCQRKAHYQNKAHVPRRSRLAKGKLTAKENSHRDRRRRQQLTSPIVADVRWFNVLAANISTSVLAADVSTNVLAAGSTSSTTRQQIARATGAASSDGPTPADRTQDRIGAPTCGHARLHRQFDERQRRHRQDVPELDDVVELLAHLDVNEFWS
ncbi:hypothetical protein ACP70R_026565 [Stipagrostis hirtigluma subsp. patula]